jgi:hypothetical protein
VTDLTKNLVNVPPIRAAHGQPLANRIYIVEQDNTAPQVRDGQKAVLITDDGYLELITRATPIAGLTNAGTYLDDSDYAKLSSRNKPQVRRYRWRDTWRKMLSPKGTRLLLTTALGLLTAAAGIYFAIWGADPTSAATVSDRAQSGLEWVVEPADKFDAQAAGTQVADARREVHRRELATSRCLRRLGGGDAPAASVPGILCRPESPPWYRSNDTAAWLTLAAGLLTAVLATFGLTNSFGFQKSPGAG